MTDATSCEHMFDHLAACSDDELGEQRAESEARNVVWQAEHLTEHDRLILDVITRSLNTSMAFAISDLRDGVTGARAFIDVVLAIQTDYILAGVAIEGTA